MAGHFFWRKLPQNKKSSLEIPPLITKNPAKFGVGKNDKHDNNKKTKIKVTNFYKPLKTVSMTFFILALKKMHLIKFAIVSRVPSSST